MARTFKASVAPSVLAWARKSANLRIDEVARKLSVTTAAVSEWEQGTEQPTIAQLRHFAKVCRRPLSVFLLETPPTEWQTVRDYRGVEGFANDQSPQLLLALREAHERRAVALELAKVIGEEVPSFDVRATIDDDPEAVADSIRSSLGVSEETIKELRNADAALSTWRAAAESTGVLVFGFSSVSVSEARGFSFSEQPYPVVALNSGDAPAGRVFTLMHELTHISLRAGDVLCDLGQESIDPRQETFCNYVAAAVLVPSHLLLAETKVSRASDASAWSDGEVTHLARKFKVSREVILRRLLTLGRTNEDHYRSWRKRFLEEYARYQAHLDAGEGGPSYARVVVSRLGRVLPRLVLTAYDHDSITTSAAAGYLGAKTRHFDAIAAELGGP